jgi:hypothetical protein
MHSVTDSPPLQSSSFIRLAGIYADIFNQSLCFGARIFNSTVVSKAEEGTCQYWEIFRTENDDTGRMFTIALGCRMDTGAASGPSGCGFADQCL